MSTQRYFLIFIIEFTLLANAAQDDKQPQVLVESEKKFMIELATIQHYHAAEKNLRHWVHSNTSKDEAELIEKGYGKATYDTFMVEHKKLYDMLPAIASLSDQEKKTLLSDLNNRHPKETFLKFCRDIHHTHKVAALEQRNDAIAASTGLPHELNALIWSYLHIGNQTIDRLMKILNTNHTDISLSPYQKYIYNQALPLLPIVITLQNDQSSSMLHLAADKRYVRTTQLLLEGKADPLQRDAQGQSALTLCEVCSKKSVPHSIEVQNLVWKAMLATCLVNHARDQAVDQEIARELFFHALCRHNEVGVRQSLPLVHDIAFVQDAHGSSPFFVASPNKPLMHLLMEAKASPDLQDRDGKTTLHKIMVYSFHHNSLFTVMRDFIEVCRPDPFVLDKGKRTALALFIKTQEQDIAQLTKDGKYNGPDGQAHLQALRATNQKIIDYLEAYQQEWLQGKYRRQGDRL